MQAVIQHHVAHTPSVRQALSALLLVAVFVVFGVSAFGPRVPMSANDVDAMQPTAVLPDSSRSAGGAVASVTTDRATRNVAMWPSDTMDSHESIPSLAALSKSARSNAKPL